MNLTKLSKNDRKKRNFKKFFYLVIIILVIGTIRTIFDTSIGDSGDSSTRERISKKLEEEVLFNSINKYYPEIYKIFIDSIESGYKNSKNPSYNEAYNFGYEYLSPFLNEILKKNFPIADNKSVLEYMSHSISFYRKIFNIDSDLAYYNMYPNPQKRMSVRKYLNDKEKLAIDTLVNNIIVNSHENPQPMPDTLKCSEFFSEIMQEVYEKYGDSYDLLHEKKLEREQRKIVMQISFDIYERIFALNDNEIKGELLRYLLM